MKNVLIEVNPGSQNLLRYRGVKSGEYFFKYFDGDPSYEFIVSLTSTNGDGKLSIVESNGQFKIEMDDALVKKIRLYPDSDVARMDLFSNEDFSFLKDNEFQASLF